MARTYSITGGRWPIVWRYGVSILWWLLILAVYIFAARDISLGPVTPLATVAAIGDLALGCLMIWGVRYRHRWPRTVAGVATVLGAFSASGLLAGLWVFGHLATRRRWSEILTLGVFNTFVAAVSARMFLTTEPVEGQVTARDIIIGVAVWAAIYALAAVCGSYVGARRDLLLALHERAEEAERTQELRVLQGQSDERNRIAREMHDVLAHRISLVSMHAGILAYRDDLPPEQVKELAGIIQDNAHQSMIELRTILGSLRQEGEPDASQPAPPQPGFEQVEDLFADARAVGQHLLVDQHVEHPELLPTLVGRHIYRVVQELLTNARKHAPHAKVRVALWGAPGEGVTISARNPRQLGAAQLPGSGAGLIGLKERAAVLGGTMTTGNDEDGLFEVKVWFPW